MTVEDIKLNFTRNDKLKILFMWTPRAGCSSVVQALIDTTGELENALKYSKFIHNYRINVFEKKNPNKCFIDYVKNDYKVIKFVRNPYARIVSIFAWLKVFNINITFREFINSLINKKYENITKSCINHKNYNSIVAQCKYHFMEQYLRNEEKYVNLYVKIENSKQYIKQIEKLIDVRVDLTNYSNAHVSPKSDDNQYEFYGDIMLNDMSKLPFNYKLFYDDDIKEKVTKLYQNDIIKYNYNFDDDWNIYH